jgi:hypothetical protein
MWLLWKWLFPVPSLLMMLGLVLTDAVEVVVGWVVVGNVVVGRGQLLRLWLWLLLLLLLLVVLLSAWCVVVVDESAQPDRSHSVALVSNCPGDVPLQNRPLDPWHRC